MNRESCCDLTQPPARVFVISTHYSHRHSPMNPRRLSIVLLLAFACLHLRAGVSTESPFVPRGQAATAAVNNTPIELRGMTSDEEGMRFAIYDPVRKDGKWVRIDEKNDAFVVRSFDEATNRIVVDYQGKAQTLMLVEPKFGPGKTVAGAITLPGVVPGQPGVVAANAAQPFQGRFGPQQGQIRQGQGAQQAQPQQQSADEAKRLEAIRAEVQRRRAARESGSQQ